MTTPLTLRSDPDFVETVLQQLRGTLTLAPGSRGSSFIDRLSNPWRACSRCRETFPLTDKFFGLHTGFKEDRSYICRCCDPGRS
jgi:hypothetical protein